MTCSLADMSHEISRQLIRLGRSIQDGEAELRDTAQAAKHIQGLWSLISTTKHGAHRPSSKDSGGAHHDNSNVQGSQLLYPLKHSADVGNRKNLDPESESFGDEEPGNENRSIHEQELQSNVNDDNHNGGIHKDTTTANARSAFGQLQSYRHDLVVYFGTYDADDIVKDANEGPRRWKYLLSFEQSSRDPVEMTHRAVLLRWASSECIQTFEKWRISSRALNVGDKRMGKNQSSQTKFAESIGLGRKTVGRALQRAQAFRRLDEELDGLGLLCCRLVYNTLVSLTHDDIVSLAFRVRSDLRLERLLHSTRHRSSGRGREAQDKDVALEQELPSPPEKRVRLSDFNAPQSVVDTPLSSSEMLQQQFMHPSPTILIAEEFYNPYIDTTPTYAQLFFQPSVNTTPIASW